MTNYSDINVTDRQSFCEFLDLPLKDLKVNKDVWENGNLENFLETIQFYAGDIQGYYDNTNQKVDADVATWRVFADIMRGAVL